MRKITTQTVKAFLSSTNFKSGNDSVLVGMNETCMLLHNNMIARMINGIIEVSLAGWNTNTTRDRLNGIPGCSIHTKYGTPYLNGNPINSSDWYKI